MHVHTFLTHNTVHLEMLENDVTDMHAGPPGNGTPSERQLLDAYYTEAQRFISAPIRNPNPVYIDPVVLENFRRAYQQSAFSDDRTRMLNYAKTVSCLRLISIVKVRL